MKYTSLLGISMNVSQQGSKHYETFLQGTDIQHIHFVKNTKTVISPTGGYIEKHISEKLK